MTPDLEQCKSAPPKDSAEISSPVAALTNGGPAKIQISSTTKTLLDLTEASSFATKARGPVDIKGIGIMETFWLLGRKSDRDMDDLDDIDYE